MTGDSHDSLTAAARNLWEHLAAAPVTFPSHGGVAIVASPGSLLCPPSWTGVVRLGDAAIVTAPDEADACLLRETLAEMPVDSVVRPDELQKSVPVAEVLGPASLAYLAKGDFLPVSGGAAITRLPPGHGDLCTLTDSVDPGEVGESGVDEIDSPVFVIRDGSEVLAAAGYRAWPESTAHLSVLTAARRRGRGLAQQVASAATAHALDAGLLPQWRARPEASRRVAAALGFQELGDQLSVRLEPESSEPPGSV